ncbi:MAG: adenylate kinase [Chloroflexi bacterium]|nr:adenylate kinase [Chloroflexota bacterium]
MNVVLLGPPGAGKGTQADRLKRHLNIPHIASGDLFRALARQDTPLAREVRTYMDRGEYVPDKLTIEMVLTRLQQPDARRGFLLDGFPRTLAQAQALDDALAKGGQKIDHALYITAPTELLVRRTTGRLVCTRCGAIYNLETKPPKNDLICDICGGKVERRSDESPDVVRVRLETYREQTQPLIDYYRTRGCLVTIDGSLSMEAVEQEVDRALGIGGPV